MRRAAWRKEVVQVASGALKTKVLEVVGTYMDVTAEKQTDEERKAHLYALESMERVSQAIQATDDLGPMLDHMLDAVLETFGCDRAVLGTWSDDPEPTSLVMRA